MAITGLRLSGWNQFAEVDLDLSEGCTILTGANGAGKSTILRILAKHAGWDFYDLRIDPVDPAEGTPGIPADHRWIGEIRYDGLGEAALLSQEARSSRKEPRIHVSNLNDERCIYIPAVRPAPPARATQLPEVGAFTPAEALQQVATALRAANDGMPGENAILVIARILQAQLSSDQVAPAIAQFMEACLSVLPPELGIERFELVEGRVALVAQNERFSFNAMSGGTASLVLATWLCAMFNASGGPGTVLFDEPENHLHPALQRKVLPSLVEAFPRLRFVVSTHSPLVVGSVRGAREYALAFAADGVRAVDLGPLVRAGTASDFLEDVLGVKFSGPVWAEEAIGRHYGWLRNQPISLRTLDTFEVRMKRDGLEKFVPRHVVRAMKERLG